MKKTQRLLVTAMTVLLTVAMAALIGLGSPAQTGASRLAPSPATSLRAAPVAFAGTVYLTFDDGPHATWTPRVLAVLRKYGVRAVFFEIGQNIAAQPSVTRSLRSAGMLIGNHTWSHADLTLLSTASVTSQLNRMESALGYRPRCVRPPYGATSARIQAIIADRGQRHILWTVDPRDWSRPGTTVIVNRVLAGARDGSRVLLHDGGGDRSQTVAALDLLVPQLRARGFVIGLMAC